MSYSVLLHRGTEWGGNVRGSTNVFAKKFLDAGHPTTWLMRPRHFGHTLFRRGSNEKGGAWRSEEGTLVINPWTIVPRLPWRSIGPKTRAWLALKAYHTIYPDLRRTLEKFNQPEPKLIFSAGSDMSGLRKYFPKAKRIVQCVDLYEVFGGASQNLTEELDYADADAVISIGCALADFLHEYRKVPREKIHIIGEGVDLDLYQQNHAEPEDLKSAAYPRLVWVGVVSKADPSLMHAALRALPDGKGSLVIIGPPVPWATQLAAEDSRVHLLGSRKPEIVPAYLRYCDIGVMLYNQLEPPLKYLGQNPIKLYEFAGAGLAIISTPHVEFKYLKPPCLVINSPAEVGDALREALSRREELGRQGIEFARNYTWQIQFDRIIALAAKLGVA